MKKKTPKYNKSKVLADLKMIIGTSHRMANYELERGILFSEWSNVRDAAARVFWWVKTGER